MGSGVASPEILGGPKIKGSKMFDFRGITLFWLEKRVSKQKMTIFSKNLGWGHGPLDPSLRLWSWVFLYKYRTSRYPKFY